MTTFTNAEKVIVAVDDAVTRTARRCAEIAYDHDDGDVVRAIMAEFGLEEGR